MTYATSALLEVTGHNMQADVVSERKVDAIKLLAALGGTKAIHDFRTFDDTSQERKHLTKKLRGTIEETWSELEHLNDLGAGVFVMVNTTDGNGQKTENVTKVRAVFADTDGAPIEPIVSALKPHVVVETSPGKYHAYFRVEDCSCEEFFSIQQAIAEKFGADTSVCDLPRVMRLPGFYHLKGEPYLTRITEFNKTPRYKVGEIVAAFDLTLGEGRQQVNRTRNPFAAALVNHEPETSENVERTKSMLAVLDPDPHPSGEGKNRVPYRNTIWALASTGWPCGYELARNWAAGGDLFDQAVFDRDWKSFDQNGGINYGTLVHYAKQAGWVDSTPTANALRNAWESLNDAGNADRILNSFGDKLAYVADQGRWLIRHESRWRRDSKGNINVLAISVIRSIYREAETWSATNGDLAKALSQHAGRSLRANSIEAAVKLAATNPNIAVTSDQLDADNFLLGVRNGVLDLHTGTLRDEQREDWITRSALVEYVPTATCPTWLAFLDSIMAGNRDLIDFLQTLAGYCMTGDTREQKFVFFYGTGANGKSTFLNTLRELLGGYAVQARPETLMLAKHGTQAHGHTADLMPLIGARLAAANETEEGQRLAESLIKQITGGEPIMVRSPYGKESVLVMPQFKVIMAGNHRPIIRGTDHGIWRRLVCVPFTVTIPDDQQDKGLMDKLRDEFPGILNWMLEGCLRWQRVGLSIPPILQSERQTYMTSMDIMARWIDEVCEVVSGHEWGVRKAYMNFSLWCTNGGYGAVSETRFSQQLDEKGFERKRTNKGSVLLGLEPRQGTLV